MITPVGDASSLALGARWTRATELLGREARRLSESRLTRFQRRRAVRRIQVLEAIARRAMNDYRLALERQFGTTVPPCQADARGEHRVH